MQHIDLPTTCQRISAFKAKQKVYRRFCERAAVAIILRESEQGPQVLMVKRADRKGDPWSGDMAFPGGKHDLEDTNSLATARRETFEEIGLDISASRLYVGRLSELTSLSHGLNRLMVITPHVFILEDEALFNMNHEVKEVIWIPLEFFLLKSNRTKFTWQSGILKLNVSCYFYQQFKVWGLSLTMLDRLLHIIEKPGPPLRP